MDIDGSRWVFKTNLKSDDSVETITLVSLPKVTINLWLLTFNTPSVPSSKLQRLGCVVDCNQPTLRDESDRRQECFLTY